MKKLGLTGIAALTFLYSSACDKPQPPKQPAATQEKDHVEFNIRYITSDIPGKYAGVVIQVNNPGIQRICQRTITPQKSHA